MTENIIRLKDDPLLTQLKERLETNQADLVTLYFQALRETLFSNRSEIRPALLKQIAIDEAKTFQHFLLEPLSATAVKRGEHLCQSGLSELAALQLGQATRHFFFTHLERELLISAWQATDAYHHAVIQGFMQTREKIILNEQERIRSALQRTLTRYTVQMEAAASVAGATTTILDRDTLLQTSVELIRERFDLYYVGIFLVDADNRWAILHAGTGAAGKEMLRHGHQLEVNGNSMVGKCIARGEPRIALEVSKDPDHFENPLLPETHSEAAVPLLSRGKTKGALTVQSQRVSAFSDQDVTALQIIADQLVNAIENAHLFSELRGSEERYRTILENIEEGYYEMDLAGNFTFLNDSTCTIFGYPKAEILGTNYRRFVDPETLTKVLQMFTDLYQTGELARSIEYKIMGTDETARFVETSASLIRDTADQPIGFRGIVRDITRRKQTEQLLIERKALERSNKELEQFAYVASHDLQEPLRKIQTFGDQLKVEYGATLNEEALNYLERMLNAARRMETLIHDLLSLSRVAIKGQPFVPVDLGQIVGEVISDLEARVEQTGGRVEVGALPSLEADPLQMRQLLQNLIGNGLKFHRPGEAPLIKVSSSVITQRRATKGLGTNNRMYQIVVKDNGIGFNEKYLDRIFQPFQRLHGRNEYEGTGIGLSICQRIVERHGGRITAKSAPGEGATFIFTLPAHQTEGETIS